MPTSSQMRLNKSVQNLIHSFVQRFEFACQVDSLGLGKQLNTAWHQIRLTLSSYPSIFPPEVLPEVFQKHAHAESLIKEANQAENPVLWLIEQVQPLCDYLDDIAVSKKHMSYA